MLSISCCRQFARGGLRASFCLSYLPPAITCRVYSNSVDLLAALTRAHKLRSQLTAHNHAYYVLSAPTVTDSAYDKLMAELEALEAAHPSVAALPDSPTRTVGSDRLPGRETRRHETAMLSLKNGKSWRDVELFVKRVCKGLGAQSFPCFSLQLKYDGVAANLTFSGNQQLECVTTRGDGEVGDVITEAFTRYVTPPSLSLPSHTPCVVRGEVVARAASRNVASGLLRRLPNTGEGEGEGEAEGEGEGEGEENPPELVLFPYAVTVGGGASQESSHIQSLLAAGADPAHLRAASTMEELREALAALTAVAESIRADIRADGIVIRVDSQSDFERLGRTQKAPRGALAFKFPVTGAKAQLLQVVSQVGRSGKATPVALLSPTTLGDALISRATLHSFRALFQSNVHPGDAVRIVRSGDVIPQVLLPTAADSTPFEGNLLDLARAHGYETPIFCPCTRKAPLVSDGSPHLFCSQADCTPKLVGAIDHLCGKQGIDIPGFSKRTIETLVAHGILTRPLGVFDLATARENMLTLNGFAEKKVSKLLSAVGAARADPGLARGLILGLGIPGVGRGKTKQLLDAHGGDVKAVLFSLDGVIDAATLWEDLSSVGLACCRHK